MVGRLMRGSQRTPATHPRTYPFRMCGGYYRRSDKQRIGDASNISDLPSRSERMVKWACNPLVAISETTAGGC